MLRDELCESDAPQVPRREDDRRGRCPRTRTGRDDPGSVGSPRLGSRRTHTPGAAVPKPSRVRLDRSACSASRARTQERRTPTSHTSSASARLRSKICTSPSASIARVGPASESPLAPLALAPAAALQAGYRRPHRVPVHSEACHQLRDRRHRQSVSLGAHVQAEDRGDQLGGAGAAAAYARGSLQLRRHTPTRCPGPLLHTGACSRTVRPSTIVPRTFPSRDSSSEPRAGRRRARPGRRTAPSVRPQPVSCRPLGPKDPEPQ